MHLQVARRCSGITMKCSAAMMRTASRTAWVGGVVCYKTRSPSWGSRCAIGGHAASWAIAHLVHGGVGGPSSGGQGVGKGIFISSVVDMLAPYSSSLSSHKQLLGNFNAILANKCLVFLDEVGWRQTLLC